MSIIWSPPAPPLDPVPSKPSSKSFWVRLRYKATGHEATFPEKTAENRALLIILTAAYCDVVDQWETESHGG